MGIRKKCLIITLLCFSSLMHASEFMFKLLEVKDGLSNNQVLDIFKDSEGFMWFATASGLNRYDGCQMTLFRSNNADPASLPDNYIKSIQEDYKGNLWILTGVGYVIYNSESETFGPPTVPAPRRFPCLIRQRSLPWIKPAVFCAFHETSSVTSLKIKKCAFPPFLL